ncbi:DUF2252 domain-containing protein [Pseudomonas sp. CCI3.2]|uniref:DUF2252 domain-containing protein n=1 Tax=unclassified Pseudomonas TaxID=196821 RepID=UPI002AC8E6CA|nr:MULTISPECIES: DUF2252 domain-containing protein [unclassified Pseudomonas]MEB0078466.1 DUF2252 domain-containing protein [Pseudomonas sp. MH10out]MEB0090128.1 DUF2252 domain-containing protein [Pseudomonas sp. CCI4.2]MEB0103980.1 DUF2252 domain-containing protein [Pseudomonas sp. CCI3.2]MEB0131751.1 DUF2252 domain-containing protein [Pseudomonas sp. CCI2.4]MEB0158089.1 DUF2252 domain-containing protein [Pseudomonas sp. AH2 (2023)]
MTTLKDRLKLGKDARKHCSRRSQAEHGDTHRDPISLIETSSEGRIQPLVELRYGRMLVSPFTFYRGNALLHAHDLAGTPNMGLTVPVCGDCHLMNFGGFATPERNLLFSVNDFDEAHPGPWEWDLKRLVASFLIAARDLRHGKTVEESVCREVVTAYQQAMAECAQQGALELWYDAIRYEDLLEQAKSDSTLAHVERAVQKAERRTHAELLPKISERDEHGHLLIRDDLPEIFHLHNATTLLDADDDWMGLKNWQALYETFMRDYRPTLQADRRALLGRFEVQDMAFKVVGVGSVGTRCLVALLTDDQQHPLFLQIKEARASVLSGYVSAKSRIRHNGQRVVDGQRLMQSASDLFLGWTTGPNGRHFYVRQLRDMKISAELETFDSEAFAAYGRICGRALAHAHAKASGCAAEISGYIGKGPSLADALLKYAQAYAEQNERDFERFQKACRTGRLQARSEADLAADHLP